MTNIKLCGLSREEDILTANELKPDYIGFVFAKKSKRYVSPERAKELKALLDPEIQSVGVFVNEEIENVAKLLENGVIDVAQLHGNEDEEYIKTLREHSQKPIFQAFKITSEEDVRKAEESSADYVLLDAGAGDGTVFDWSLVKEVNRPYFLAGGLDSVNVSEAVKSLHPYGVDVSSGIETNGKKDKQKMAAFVAGVRKEDKQ